ncbi:MAG: asparaginase domain-containing protein [Marinobacterium sp.]|nr:asparaginase domain-containing protein [Marinobacterium sp.]
MTDKILIVYTGGTIGMEPSDQGYVPSAGLYNLLERQLSHSTRSTLPPHDLLELPELIDSSNLQPQHWTQIASVLKQQWHEYRGFVVLHGTDSMAYTASMLSFIFAGTDKPIILTGSQIPLSQARSDGVENLASALAFANVPQLHEVCLYFGGRLLRGNRASKVASDGFTAFDSPNYSWLGDVGINLRLNEALLLPQSETFNIIQLQIPDFQAERVLVLPIYPGMPSQTLSVLFDNALSGNSAITGIVLQSYGVGNPPDADPHFMALLEKACQRDLLVLNISHCHSGHMAQGAYASGHALNALNVISGNDMTLEAAVAKMNMALTLPLSRQQQREWLARPVCGERS